MLDYTRVVDALRRDDKEGLLASFKDAKFVPGSGPQAWDLQVEEGKFGDVSLGPTLDYHEGDTLLHLAMRNKKWMCKISCHELGVDASIVNINGKSPPLMHLFASAPRFMSTLVVLVATWFWPAIWKLAGPVGFVMELACFAMASADLFLAVRWCYLVYVLRWYHHAKEQGLDPASGKAPPSFLERVQKGREEARYKIGIKPAIPEKTSSKKKGKKKNR